MRTVTTRVLPVPAPASTSSGPSVVVTACRCSAFSDASSSAEDGGNLARAGRLRRGFGEGCWDTLRDRRREASDDDYWKILMLNKIMAVPSIYSIRTQN